MDAVPPAFPPSHTSAIAASGASGSSEMALLRQSVFALEHASASDMLPTNETEELRRRVGAGQGLLQSFYEAADETVQHRRVNAAHARSIAWISQGAPNGGPGSGGAGSWARAGTAVQPVWGRDTARGSVRG